MPVVDCCRSQIKINLICKHYNALYYLQRVNMKDALSLGYGALWRIHVQLFLR